MKLRILTLVLCAMLLAACGRPREETTVQRKDLTELIFASGELEPDQLYNLTAQTEGYLIELDVREGDLVTKGQTLALIDNSQNIINAASASDLYTISRQNILPEASSLKQIEVNIQAAKAKLAHDRLQAERYKQLHEHNTVSRLEYESKLLEVNQARASLNALQEQYKNQKQLNLQQEIQQRSNRDLSKVTQETNHLKAILNGKIYQLKKQLGDYVRKGDVIATIGSPDVLYARLNIDESNMSKIQLGQPAVIRLNIDKEKTYQAEICEILPTFDVNSQSFIIKAFLMDELPFRISGTQLEANIIIGEKQNALVIPRSFFGYGNKVLLNDSQAVLVKPGIVSSEWVEILEGLEEGQTIVRQQL